MPQKIYSKILQWGIYVSFLLFFLINNNWLYPYSTPKQIYFNILMEILAVVWFALIIKYPEARPKKSWLTWSFLGWLAVLLVTCFTGVDFNLSFWGDANRMMGWFHLAHWFIFYLILITVFKNKADWQKLFNLSLITAALMVIYSLVKAPETGFDPGTTVNMGNNISTLGNATYVAGVMLVCFYFAIKGVLENKLIYQKIIYGLAGILVLIGFGYSDVSGSQAGLAVSLIIFGLLYTFLAAGKKAKKITLIGIGAFIAIIAALYSLRGAPFMQNQFGKLFRDFSFQNTNLNTRVYAWRAAWQGFKEKPVLGWGYGNFGVVFDKYFDGSYYRYTMDEEYFDRTHSNPLDLLVTTGVIGLLIYLSIFVFSFIYLIRGYRQKRFGWLEFSLAAAIIIGYFIHNLAVFDSWANYFLFFMVLAWIYCLHQGGEENYALRRPAANQEIMTWLLAGAGAIFLIFNYNLAFAENFKGAIKFTDILRTTPPGSEVMAYYQEPFKGNSPMDRSGIDVVSDFVDGKTETLANLTKEEKKKLFDYIIELNKKTASFNPNNSLSQARLGRTQVIACLHLEDKKYCQDSFAPLAKSMADGGEHATPYMVKVAAQLYLNDVDGAVATLNQVLKFYDGYTKANCQLAQIYIKLKNSSDADRASGREYMKKCVAGGGGENFAGGNDAALSQEYKNAQETIRAEAQAKAYNEKAGQYQDLIKEALRLKGAGDAGDRDKYYQAIDAFKRASEAADNKVWIPFLNIGNLYKILGDYGQAEENYNKALEVSKGDVTVYLQKIELYQLYMKKSPDDIRHLYQTALKTVTDNVNLVINYGAFCRDNGYTEDAIKAYSTLLKSYPDNKSYQEELDNLKAKK